MVDPAATFLSWEEELKAAADKALEFTGLTSPLEWTKYRAPPPNLSQFDAWRTMRNRRGECALKDCNEPLDQAVEQDGFLYCSDAHANKDRRARRSDAKEK
jgi:hypothetical protein